MTIEQINNTGGTVFYLHHDQQGSTRLVTSTAGKTEATYTYDAYGNETGHTGTVTAPLGYDAQLTSSDTGLIYLRARVYDPKTVQFLSVDPLVGETHAPYAYAGNSPLNYEDPTGLDFFEEAAEGIAGWGDEFTFGATKLVREELGINNVNTCSTAYQAGGYAGLATAVLLLGTDEAEAGLIASDGTRITGFTRHGINRVIGDGASRAGVSPAALRDAITNGVKTAEGVDRLGRPFRVLTGTDARVVVNPETARSFRRTHFLEPEQTDSRGTCPSNRY